MSFVNALSPSQHCSPLLCFWEWNYLFFFPSRAVFTGTLSSRHQKRLFLTLAFFPPRWMNSILPPDSPPSAVVALICRVLHGICQSLQTFRFPPRFPLWCGTGVIARSFLVFLLPPSKPNTYRPVAYSGLPMFYFQSPTLEDAIPPPFPKPVPYRRLWPCFSPPPIPPLFCWTRRLFQPA